MQEFFDIANCEENKENQGKLFRLIERGEGVLFIGSGISRRLLYPSWEGLLIELRTLISTGEDLTFLDQKIANGELLLAAEIIKSKLDAPTFNEAFKRIFSPKNPSHDEFHKLLVSLKFKGFVTTNYDPCLELALGSIQNPLSNYGIVISEIDKSRVHYFLNSIVNPNLSERYHLYLHGKYDIPSSVVLSYSDYVAKYDGFDIHNIDVQNIYNQLIQGRIEISDFESQSKLRSRAFRTLHYKAIYPLFATQRLVFAGFGLRDDYLNKIIDDIQDDFDPIMPNHFALFSDRVAKSWTKLDYLQEKKNWISKGVELIFYKDDSSYQGIVDFFQSLSPESYIEQRDATLESTKTEANVRLLDNETEVDESVNARLIERAKKIAEALKNK